MIQRHVIDIFSARPGELTRPAPLQGDFRFRRIVAAEFETSALGREKERAARFAERLSRGHQAWGYFAAGDSILACYLWLSGPQLGDEPPNFESGLLAGVPRDAVYIWDCRTHLDYERRGLYRNGLWELASRVADFGARTALIVTRRENARSQDSILAVGFRQSGALTCYRFRGLVLACGDGAITLTRAGSVFALTPKVQGA